MDHNKQTASEKKCVVIGLFTSLFILQQSVLRKQEPIKVLYQQKLEYKQLTTTGSGVFWNMTSAESGSCANKP